MKVVNHGIIIAGGKGTRLRPLTDITNKNLLPIGKKPMIQHGIEKMVNSGIKDILVITGTEHIGAMAQYLGSGKKFGCRITLRVQDSPGGIAQALGLGKNFSNGNKICALLGDNIFEDDLNNYVDQFNNQDYGAMLLLKKVNNPERFGVAVFSNNTIIRVDEKPKNPLSNSIVTGIYFYDSKIYDIIDQLKPSARGELEITDVNNIYLNTSKLTYSYLNGFWIDCGTHESLSKANRLIFEKKGN